MSEIVAVINPMAGRGRTAREWPAMAAKLEAAGLTVTTRFTNARGDGAHQARQALHEGASTVIAVGGDGTIHEVVNGFFMAGTPVRPGARLGILPAGSGSDLIKSLGIPRHQGEAVAALAAGFTRTIDLGWVNYVNHEGDPESRYFVNTASVGLPGAVLQSMHGLPGFLPGPVRYNLASLKAMLSFSPPPITLAMDDNDAEEARMLLVVLGNGRYFGGGMRVAPDASLEDGLLDIIGVRAASLPRVLACFPRIYAGTHLDLPEVEHGRGARLAIEGDDPLLLELDGEQPGTTPAVFQAVPKALQVIVPAAADGL